MTFLTVIEALIMETSLLRPVVGLRMLRLIVVPAGPEIRFTTWNRLRPVVSWPLTPMMMSPGRSPAFCAGLPSNGATMTTCSPFIITSAPIPLYFPFVNSSCSLIISGERKVL